MERQGFTNSQHFTDDGISGTTFEREGFQKLIAEVEAGNVGTDYAERYRMELALYDRAERYLKEHLGSDTTLKLKAWKVEVATLTNEKDRLYRKVRSLRTEVQEAESVRRCVEQVQPEQQKEHIKRRDIEL